MNIKEKQTKKRGHLYRNLQAMSIVPVLVLGLVVIIVSAKDFTTAIHGEIEVTLNNVSSSVSIIYDSMYPGDYILIGDVAYEFVKGDTVLTRDYSIIDSLKEQTGLDITIFYQDTRILTTLRNEAGERIIGTGADERVLRDVLATGEPHFYTNATVDKTPCFAYYTPLKNSDGSVVGMVCALKSASAVNTSVHKVLLPLVFVTIFLAILAGYLSSFYTRKLVAALQEVKLFLSKVSTGNLATEMNNDILIRNDELSEMARSAMHMQRSLRKLVEEDTLTSLPNRRFGDQKLKQIHSRAQTEHSHFTVVIGDIDHFKKVNDTYGHECGDVVLQKVGDILRRNMNSIGFAARWGGEEFLLVFDRMDAPTAISYLNKIAEEVRALTIDYDNHTINVTITFGVTEGDSNSNVKQILRDADDKLYIGKSSGRNCIIS